MGILGFGAITTPLHYITRRGPYPVGDVRGNSATHGVSWQEGDTYVSNGENGFAPRRETNTKAGRDRGRGRFL
jgi:hypothetical protein